MDRAVSLVRTFWAGAAVLAASSPLALAHQLNVFAYVDEQIVIVETKFSSGKVPVTGDVRVLDGNSKLLQTLTLNEDGQTHFPLDSVDASGGLLIEVDVGDGHDDYWILTPEDISRQSGQ